MRTPKKKKMPDVEREKNIMRARALVKELYSMNPEAGELARGMLNSKGDTTNVRRVYDWAKKLEEIKKKKREKAK